MEFPMPKIPPADDATATLRWLRDVELVKAVPQRYAYGVDTGDFELVRSCFHPECEIVGTLESGGLDAYLEGIEAGLRQWAATMHFMGNQYVAIDGDRAYCETWSLAHHMEAEGSPIPDLVLALRYQEDLVRVGDDWKIIRRTMVKQFHRGPFPRPTIGPPSYPRPPQ